MDLLNSSDERIFFWLGSCVFRQVWDCGGNMIRTWPRCNWCLNWLSLWSTTESYRRWFNQTGLCIDWIGSWSRCEACLFLLLTTLQGVWSALFHWEIKLCNVSARSWICCSSSLLYRNRWLNVVFHSHDEFRSFDCFRRYCVLTGIRAMLFCT